MTPAQAAWLRKLKDEGPQVCYRRGRTGYLCRIKGWSGWAINAHEIRDYSESITPAGLAALEAYEGDQE